MGIASLASKKVLSPTAVAMGMTVASEDAEGAYIPLRAFYESGSEAAKALYKKAKAAIDAGADEDKLYQDFLVYKSEDNVYKVDVPELKARNKEYAQALTTFVERAEDLMTKERGGVTRMGTISDYLPDESPVFEYFPDLKKAKVTIKTASKKDGDTLGYYDPATQDIVVYVPSKVSAGAPVTEEESLKRAWRGFGTLIHEFQHHIQDVKGALSDGSNYETARANKPALSKRLRSDIDQEIDFKEMQIDGGFLEGDDLAEAKSSLESLKKERAGLQAIADDSMPPTHAIYIRDIGESEARSSGVKATLTGDERRRIGVFYPKDQGLPPQTGEALQEKIDSGAMPLVDPDSILVREISDNKLQYTQGNKTYSVPEQVNVNSEVAKKGLGAKDLPSSAFAGALGLDMARKEVFGEADESTKSGINSAIYRTTAGKLYSALRDEAPADTTYADSDLVTEAPILGDILFAADVLQGVSEAFPQEDDAELPEPVDEFTGVEFAQGGLMEQHMQMEADRLAGKQEPEQKKEPRYEDFGLTSTDMIAPALTGTTEDVVDAAHISRSFSSENKFEDSDRTEDTMRHILLGGLVFGDMKNDSLFEKGQRWVADKLIDAREYKEKLQNDNPENDIDLNNNEYGRQLRQLFPDREEFIEAVKTLTAGMYKGEEVPDIGGVKPQLSYGNAGPARPEPNQGLMSDE